MRLQNTIWSMAVTRCQWHIGLAAPFGAVARPTGLARSATRLGLTRRSNRFAPAHRPPAPRPGGRAGFRPRQASRAAH